MSKDLFHQGKAYRNPHITQQEQHPFQNTAPQVIHQPHYGDFFPEHPFDMPGAAPYYPVPSQQPADAGTGTFLDKLPIKDIKGWIDRMGGIDGILNAMNKVNSVVKTVQQMSPMLKLLFGAFAGKAATTDTSKGEYKKRSGVGRSGSASRSRSRRRAYSRRSHGRSGYGGGRSGGGRSGGGRSGGRRR